jgi:hypothetical protein
MEECDKTIH